MILLTIETYFPVILNFNRAKIYPTLKFSLMNHTIYFDETMRCLASLIFDPLRSGIHSISLVLTTLLISNETSHW